MAPSPPNRLTALREGPLVPLLLSFSWPAIVSMSLNMLYNVVDRIYIGQGCGADAIAGLALTFPVMLVVGAVGPLIGVGSSTEISIQLGRKAYHEAERTLGQMVALKLLFGLLAPFVLYFLVLDPAFALMGADKMTPESVRLGRLYCGLVLPFMLTQHLAFGLSGTIRAEGAPVRSMRCMVIGCVANLVLDPILIFGCHLGVAGAAWATNLAMVLSCLDALSYYFREGPVLRIRACRLRLYADLAPRVLAIGMAPFLMEVSLSCVTFAMNRAFALWSPTPRLVTSQIAAFSIWLVSGNIFFTPLMGIQQGLAPILGYNWGAKAYDRIRAILRLGFWLTSALCVGISVAQVLLAHPLAWCFARSDPLLVEHGARAISVGNCCVWIIGINVLATTYFQSIGRPATAIVLSLLRQVFCLIPCAFLLPYLFPEDPVLGIWLAMPLSDVLTALATAPTWYHEMRVLARRAAATNSAAAPPV